MLIIATVEGIESTKSERGIASIRRCTMGRLSVGQIEEELAHRGEFDRIVFSTYYGIL